MNKRWIWTAATSSCVVGLIGIRAFAHHPRKAEGASITATSTGQPVAVRNYGKDERFDFDPVTKSFLIQDKDLQGYLTGEANVQQEGKSFNHLHITSTGTMELHTDAGVETVTGTVDAEVQYTNQRWVGAVKVETAAFHAVITADQQVPSVDTVAKALANAFETGNNAAIYPLMSASIQNQTSLSDFLASAPKDVTVAKVEFTGSASTVQQGGLLLAEQPVSFTYIQGQGAPETESAVWVFDYEGGQWKFDGDK